MREIMLLDICMVAGLLSTAIAQTTYHYVVIVANGNILTLTADQPTASTMAIRDGRIIEVGDLVCEKDKNGELTGYLNGQPAFFMVGKLPALPRETTMNSANYHARNGFTTTT